MTPLWTIEQVCEFFQVRKTAAYRAIFSRPDFPAAIKLPGGPKRYVSAEVIAWAEQQRERKEAA